MRLFLPFLALLMVMVSGPVSRAEPDSNFKERAVGDWKAIEDAQKRLGEIRSLEILELATTKALEGRGGTLGIAGCGRFSVTLSFYPNDEQFSGGEPAINDNERIIFIKVLPQRSGLSAVVLSRVAIEDTETFFTDADDLVSGTKLLTCPTGEEGPRCMSFSLRGFTSALNMVCPKR